MPQHTNKPFQIFSWQTPFLPAIKQYISGLDGETILIVPNNRPWRYLQDLYRQDGHVAIMPKMLKIDDLVDLWLGPARRGRIAPLLDCVSIMYRCVQEIAAGDAMLQKYFGSLDLQHFLPWGKHLARLAEDVFRQMLSPEDMLYTEGEVAAPAAALLGALGKICTRYQEVLVQEDMTTLGLDYQLAGEMAAVIPGLCVPEENRHVVIAGFCQVDAAEEKLLHSLWQTGAHVCLHTDPALAEGSKPHWSCAPHREWIDNWHAAVALYENPTPKFAPEIHFFEGYDSHSQLAALREDLHIRGNDLTSTAIILSDNNLLIPTLEHLPHKGVNVSMGYPLARSQLAQFCTSILNLHSHTSSQGKLFWKDVLKCLQHPCVSLLGHLKGDPRFTGRLHALCKTLRSESRYINAESVLGKLRGNALSVCKDSLDELLGLILRDRSTVTTCAQMADWLDSILALFPEIENPVWKDFHLESETIHRLRHSVLPALRNNLLSDRPFSFFTLQAIVSEHFEQVRVPYEADPITGLQVIGLLETRLLQFDHVYILDATDDKLPGTPSQDPLLPDTLRTLIGLPDSRKQERTTAYNLYRLAACAKDVHVYWQEGMSHSSLFDAKKSRSRFVEQWIWEEEKKSQTLFKRGCPPLQTAKCTLEPFVASNAAMEKTPGLAQAMAKLLQKPISATMLNSFLQCPLAFARHYLLGLQASETIKAGDDPAAVGTCLHSVLQKLYTPFIGKEFRPGAITDADIDRELASALQGEDIKNLPADSYLMLEIMARKRLRTFVAKQNDINPAPMIVSLEKRYQTCFHSNGKQYTLKGFVDRLDMREGMAVVLDYKTGNLHLPKTELWTASDFFNDIARLCGRSLGQGQPDCASSYAILLEEMPNIQLPVYIALLAREELPVGNACLVALKDDCDEHYLFRDLDAEQTSEARKYCELAIGLVLRQMEETTMFGRDESGKSCEWCPYAGLCTL